MDQNKLIDLAWKARENAYVPYSHFKVGACIALKDGTFVQGCNIENAAYGSTMCAERNAIANMITHKDNKIEKVLVITTNGRVLFPCGSCRELMMQLDESAAQIEILMSYPKVKTILLKELLPNWWA